MAATIDRELYSTADAARVLCVNKILLRFVAEQVLGDRRENLAGLQVFTAVQVRKVDAYFDHVDPAGRFRAVRGGVRGARRQDGFAPTSPRPSPALTVEAGQIMLTSDVERELRVLPILLQFVTEAVLKIERARLGNSRVYTREQVARVDSYLAGVDPGGRFRVSAPPRPRRVRVGAKGASEV